MPSSPDRPSGDDAFYTFAFTKLQAGMLAAGLLALVGLAFGLGFLASERGAGARAGMEAANAAVPPPGEAAAKTATVRLEPKPGLPGGEAAPPAEKPVDAQFYKELLAKKPPEAGEDLAPIRLPGSKAPAKTSKPAPVHREEAREAPHAAAAPPAPKAAARYTIQVLSVREADRAERSLRELRGKGIEAYIERADLKGKGVWHRLRVGRYPSRREAERALEALRAKISLKGGRIVPL